MIQKINGGIIMRLFKAIENKIYDTLSAGIDVVEKGFDVFSSAVDTIIDKAGDIKYTVENTFIDAEYYTKEIINTSNYIAKTKDFKETSDITHSIKEITNSVKRAKIEITEDMKVIIRNYNTLADKVKFISSFFNISDEEAKELIKEYGLRD
jgi:hypothetical protein